ncbi:hypothetical protein SK128_010953 [Halocaridina rubra]|uniref:Uncharacterized protein n=1 Tax=Halocaridina rubra TaxID=373956 RepID=A0AAN9ACD9_HALRR
MLRLITYACLVLLVLGDDKDVINVPEDVLKFIIGCRQAQPGAKLGVPVHQTNIDDNTGTTSQQVSILSLSELRTALKGSVHSEAVVNHIMRQLEEATKTGESAMGRSECSTIENNISISVPAEEIDLFNNRMTMLMQMNSIKMLEQINTLFSFNLRNQKTETEKYIKRRTNKILEKLDKIMEHLGISMEDGDDYDYYDMTGEGDSVTTLPPEVTTSPASVLEIITELPTTVRNTDLVPDVSVAPPEIVVEAETSPAAKPTPAPTSAPTEVEPVTEAVGVETNSTDIFPPVGDSSSEEEGGDNDNPGFVRVSQQNPSESAPLESPQRIESNRPIFTQSAPERFPEPSVIGFIPPLQRPRPIAATPYGPVYPGMPFEERVRLSALNRRKVNRPSFIRE